MTHDTSPYLESGRLEKVLAAIQILGSYEWASRKAKSWSDKLETAQESENWLELFSDHPEFFRVSKDSWVSLRWRHGYDKIYSVAAHRELTTEELKALAAKPTGEKLTRKPLTPEQIAGLMKTAIELHGRAIAHEQEKRWLRSLLFPVLGGVLGGMVVAGVQALLK
ncbi:MAG: N-carbamoyl-L-amino acid amidohydrolase [Planctomycetota bacterium]